MLFNSGVFLKFFAAFLLLYWLVRRDIRARNILIVAASYVFYGWWDYRFLGLILLSSLLDFAIGLGIARQPDARRRRLWLAGSIVANLAILGFFKYFDFFAASFGALLQKLGLPFKTSTLGIILPVGVSFYTFQAMSYTIDVYRGNISPCRNIINFLAFVSFFPQLVAGPIERASHLLPQFERALSITRPMLEEGLWLIIWGMFKKVAIADNLDALVTMAFQTPADSGPVVAAGTIAFGFQIYCDFSGYSDIARGLARILGFDIMVNFRLPYFASDTREFWQRWHISLSTWLRDYLYISLGGNRRGTARTGLNLFTTMVLGGLWHGAAWNFVLWGAWHGAGLVVHRLWSRTASRPYRGGTESARDESEAPSPSNRLSRAASWLLTMLFVFYGWLLFRAQSFEQIVSMTRALGNVAVPVWFGSYVINLVAFVVPLIMMEIWQFRSREQVISLRLSAWPRAILQAGLLLAIILYWERKELPFIYFQF